METIIRPAAAGDLGAILEIMNYNILHTSSNYDYEVKTMDYIHEWYKEKQKLGFPLIVAEQDGLVTGYGTYGTFRGKYGYRFTVEHSVYVAVGHIGKGMGSLLLAQLITLARQGGYHTMIGGIDADNKDSIAFHLKFGFTDAGLIKEAAFKFDRWLDLQFMQLLL